MAFNGRKLDLKLKMTRTFQNNLKKTEIKLSLARIFYATPVIYKIDFVFLLEIKNELQ